MTVALRSRRTATLPAAGGERTLATVPVAPALSPADELTLAAILAAARRVMAARGYEAASYVAIGEAAGVSPASVRRFFPTKMELALETLQVPRAMRGASRLARLSGREIVTQYLQFWETGQNTAILLSVFRAAANDGRIVRDVERFLTAALVRPLAWGLQSVDACPRIRLMMSQLAGLAVSRYVLREEPLASADCETLACWMGPPIDGLLHGALGAG